LDFRAAVTSSAVKCILLEEPTYLSEKRLETCHASFERQHVKAFFLRSGTKWYRQRATSIKIAEKLGIHQSEIIAVGMQE
jgi:hypothetical protein